MTGTPGYGTISTIRLTNSTEADRMGSVPFTVKGLLDIPLFHGAKMIGGETGLSNEIEYVDHMEMPDLTGWLRPKELILTTGYSFQSEPSMLGRLLDEMHRVGGSAVGIKTKRFLQDIPLEAIAKSNAYGIPLFDIPLDITFMDMTHAIMDRILQRQTYLLREVQEVNQQFTQLVLNRKVAELVVLLGKQLDCEVAVMNLDGDIECRTPGFPNGRETERLSIGSGSHLLGYLAVTRTLGEGERFERMCLDHAVTLLALEFTIRQTQQLHRTREQEVFLVELLSAGGQQEELLAYRARQVGLPVGPYYYVIALQAIGGTTASPDQAFRIYSRISQEMTSFGNPADHSRRCVEMNGKLFILCSSLQGEAEANRRITGQYAESLSGKLGGLIGDMTLVWGMGAARQGLSELHESCKEARQALLLGMRVLPNRSIVHIHDVAVEHLLTDIGEHPALVRFQRELIEPIVRYDQEYRTELLSTLAIYLRTGSTKRVAEELYIHRNSVLYRLERIAELLQADLNEPEVRFRLELAVRHWQASGAGTLEDLAYMHERQTNKGDDKR
ncbi:PucR family transcriptional regulator ligand-binding domain-containing protein [Paenibacillus filicis]|uniref:PucR family transcriptional regulator ligand-binding domain-containing protein n=1 Tax=Paenibacillus filicis TaxID=669464 RepID=A0ABU9DG12_9BACL